MPPDYICAGGAQLEYARLSPRQPVAGRGTLVFLHEGLGSLSLWRDFPQALVDAAGAAGLVYSRRGYGRSAALPAPRAPRYLHDEALHVLPELLYRLDIHQPLLFGHSDGGSIALIHAGASGRPVQGLIVLAPHVRVEEVTISGIAAAREAFLGGGLRGKLARHHADPDAAFWGWNDLWLSKAFRDWNIEDCLPGIRCPVLAMQGVQDPYGTLEQIRIIGRKTRAVKRVELEQCGHSPHLDQTVAVLEAAVAFIGSLGAENSAASSSSSGPGRPSSNP